MLMDWLMQCRLLHRSVFEDSVNDVSDTIRTIFQYFRRHLFYIVFLFKQDNFFGENADLEKR